MYKVTVSFLKPGLYGRYAETATVEFEDFDEAEWFVDMWYESYEDEVLARVAFPDSWKCTVVRLED